MSTIFPAMDGKYSMYILIYTIEYCFIQHKKNDTRIIILSYFFQEIWLKNPLLAGIFPATDDK